MQEIVDLFHELATDTKHDIRHLGLIFKDGKYKLKAEALFLIEPVPNSPYRMFVIYLEDGTRLHDEVDNLPNKYTTVQVERKRKIKLI